MRALVLFFLLLLSVLGFGQASEDDSLPLRERLEELGIEYQAAIDLRQNIKLRNQPNTAKDYSLSEIRAQVGANYYGSWVELNVKSDFVYDRYLSEFRIDPREVNAFFTPTRWMDLKIGRQIITWGKGDYLFINDLFPKDYRSFFTGRDLQYLKAPSDAAKLSLYYSGFTFNIIYTPQFDPDIFPTGERINFFDGSGGYYFEDNLFDYIDADKWFSDDEWAFRIKKTFSGISLALYGYDGFYKAPAAFDVDNLKFRFAQMSSIGLSAESQLLNGIGKFEIGYLRSEDAEGDDPLVNNSQLRFLLGYNRDFKNDWKASMQYYHESLLQYDKLPPNVTGFYKRPLQRLHLFTFNISKMLDQQKWNLSLFTFYNMSQSDFYFRPDISYKITDVWKLQLGGNIFSGSGSPTYWSQFRHNTNLYIALRWSY